MSYRLAERYEKKVYLYILNALVWKCPCAPRASLTPPEVFERAKNAEINAENSKVTGRRWGRPEKSMRGAADDDCGGLNNCVLVRVRVRSYPGLDERKIVTEGKFFFTSLLVE